MRKRVMDDRLWWETAQSFDGMEIKTLITECTLFMTENTKSFVKWRIIVINSLLSLLSYVVQLIVSIKDDAMFIIISFETDRGGKRLMTRSQDFNYIESHWSMTENFGDKGPKNLIIGHNKHLWERTQDFNNKGQQTSERYTTFNPMKEIR